MDELDYTALRDKFENESLQNKQLRKANTRLKKKVRYLQRIIRKMKEEQAKNRKPYYKNGKRGTNYNG